MKLFQHPVDEGIGREFKSKESTIDLPPDPYSGNKELLLLATVRATSGNSLVKELIVRRDEMARRYWLP